VTDNTRSLGFAESQGQGLNTKIQQIAKTEKPSDGAAVQRTDP
jgi:hypothetical protein